MNPAGYRSRFCLLEAARILAEVPAVTQDNRNSVESWLQELRISFPRVQNTQEIFDWVSNKHRVLVTERDPEISRAEFKSWCDEKGIRLPLFFPRESNKVPNKEAYSVYTLLAAALVQQYGRGALRDRKEFLRKWLGDLERKGIEMPIKDSRTLEKAIEKAALKVDSLYFE